MSVDWDGGGRTRRQRAKEEAGLSSSAACTMTEAELQALCYWMDRPATEVPPVLVRFRERLTGRQRKLAEITKRYVPHGWQRKPPMPGATSLTFMAESRREDSQRGDWLLKGGKPYMIWNRKHLWGPMYEYTLANKVQAAYLLLCKWLG